MRIVFAWDGNAYIWTSGDGGWRLILMGEVVGIEKKDSKDTI